MPKENGTEDAKVETASEPEGTVAKPEGLSLRDALDVAIQGTKDETKGDKRSDGRANDTESHGSKDVTERAEDKIEDAPKATEAPALEPPAEWSAEEKADFAEGTRRQQEAVLRLHRARQSKLEEIKAASREHEHIKKLSDAVNPYLKAMGVKEPSEVALQKALKMWREFDEGDPKAAAAAYLKAKGIDVPKELTQTTASPDKIAEEKIAPLQRDLNELKNRIAQEDLAKLQANLATVWQSFESEKNAAGKPKYPDTANTEEGLKLAKNIGSLVGGKTELSKEFIANVTARIPGAGMKTLLHEAYKYYGGRVDESDNSRTQDTQQHIKRSSRAAASVPGSVTHSASASGSKKFKTYREAAAQALAELREREGA